jgi:hypothetical protein
LSVNAVRVVPRHRRDMGDICDGEGRACGPLGVALDIIAAWGRS